MKITIILFAIIIFWFLITHLIKKTKMNQLPTSEGNYQSVTAQEAKNLIKNEQNNSNLLILDVRSSHEFEKSHLEKAINIDINSRLFETEIEQLDKNATILLYCRSGARSASAMNIMAGQGFKSLYNMLGGIAVWHRNGFPIAS